MAKEIVKYKNDINKFISFLVNPLKLNLFMSICSNVRENGKKEVIMDFEYLRSISGYTATAIDSFVKDLRKMSKDVISVNCEIITDNKIDMFNLFSRFTIDKDHQTLTVRVNPEFTWLLNEFTDKLKGYTVFELKEFVELHSKYAKNLYRILKQWRTTGEFVFNNIDDFRIKLDVPESYANRRLMEKIIKPAISEIQTLDKSFKNIKCEPIYLHKRGRPVSGYKFNWVPEKRMNKSDQNQQSKQNGFANFHQREYDYDSLEKELLNHQNDS